jgi:short subunit dehydrogenase-like uncharacterized protein
MKCAGRTVGGSKVLIVPGRRERQAIAGPGTRRAQPIAMGDDGLMAEDEAFDVVLFGPTGVTGREVARHLSRRAPTVGLTWAVAGRDADRIGEALERVGAEPDGVLLADVSDAASIRAMVGRARVVANLVGPYASYGEPVYAACSEAGVHQVDLTGELDWVKTMIDRYGAAAEASGAEIVPTCGFEALPFDLATHLAAATAFQRHHERVVRADAAVTVRGTAKVSGPADVVSGGTYGSMVGAVRRGRLRELTDAYLLDPPEAGATGRAGRISLAPRRHAGTGEWLSPMVPAAFLNPAVIHRGAALSRLEGSDVFAPDFRYLEGSVVGDLLPPAVRRAAPVLAPVGAGLLGAGQAALGLAGRSPEAVRDRIAGLLERVGPKPGDGPAPDSLDHWHYRIDLRVTTQGGRHVDAVVEADGHPGYRSTARMVGEAALLLAGPPGDTPDRHGFLTPATALGLAHLGRFAEAGATFEVR